MKRPMQRMSQVVSSFGPGAMIDLPTRSVVIGGLDRWEMQSADSWKLLSEPRLVERLRLIFEGRSLELRTPPVASGAPGRPPRGVGVTVFPEWFVCKHIEGGGLAGARRRRLVKWVHLDPGGGRTRYAHPDTGKKEEVTPLRFVGGCEKGHLQDVDWRWVLHRDDGPCQKPMWLEERGSSGDPRDTSIVCACGKSLSLERAYVQGTLGRCEGRRPWIGDAEGCNHQLRILTRTATNTYFPLTATVISLPVGEDDLTKLVQEHWAAIEAAEVKSEADIEGLIRFNTGFRAAMQGFSVADIYAKVQQVRAGLASEAGVPIKVAEFDVFASGLPLIGQDSRTSLLHAETLPTEAWRKATDYGLGGIESVVAVHRLREVSCLYGFTRFEPAPLAAEGEFEEIRLAVNSAPLASDVTWLPAVEQLGEGIFLKFDAESIHAWLQRDDVKARMTLLRDAEAGWRQARRLPKSTFPGVPYVMLHSLAHALMTEIALECGYPASAIKERIYAIPDPTEPAKGRFGLLLYTASSGSQGTLGGLIALAPDMARIVAQALDRLDICSSDPVCADHDPSAVTDERALSGAACHGCLFVAETSCERRNQALDRSLIVESIAGHRAAFFAKVGGR